MTNSLTPMSLPGGLPLDAGSQEPDPAPGPEAKPTEHELEDLGSTLGSLLGVETNSAELRRRLVDSSELQWRERLGTALRRYDLRLLPVSRSLSALASGQRGPFPLVTFVGGPDGATPLVLLDGGGRSLRVLDGGELRWRSVASLAAALAVDPDAALPFAAAEHVRPLTRGVEHDHHPTPSGRVLALLRAERAELWVVVVYAVVVGLLSLAFPVAVQSFVSTIAFGTLLQPIVVLAILVLGCLSLAGVLRAMQSVVVERLQERVFARVVVEFAGHLPRLQGDVLRRGDLPDPVNRLFDAVVVQKALATLLLDGTAVLLSALLGMGLLAFYHPFLLAFSLLLFGLVAFVVLVLGRGGIESAVSESKAKHAVASFLEDVVRSPDAFRLAPDSALERADDLTRVYLRQRRSHYAVVLRQLGSALALQALATAGLLGVGGWLVLERKLTLGQLVAAELVVGTVVAGVAKLGKHVESYYDLAASMDKLGHVLDLPRASEGGAVPLPAGGLGLEIEGSLLMSLGAPSPALAVVAGGTLVLERGDGEAARGLAAARTGEGAAEVRVALGGIDARDAPREELRRSVAVVTAAETVAGSLFDNVWLWRPHVRSVDVLAALRDVGLEPVARDLPQRTGTVLAASGAPLAPESVMLLSIARALAGGPRVVLLDGVLDGLSPAALSDLRGALCREGRPFTLLLTTNRKDIEKLFRRPGPLAPLGVS